MKKWLAYMRGKYMKDDILIKDKYGDWCVPPESLELIHSRDATRTTEGALLATAYYYRLLTLMQRFAGIVHQPQDAQEFADLQRKIKDAFNKKYFNNTTAQYSNNTVTANLLPLYFNIAPAAQQEAVFHNIVHKIDQEYKGHISTGVIGTQWLMRGLSRWGRPDVAYHIASNRDYPSWGYMISRGATTIWELWNGDTANPAMNSHNHIMLLGDLLIWYYEDIAGIRTSPEHPGFQQIIMKPVLPEGLRAAKATYHSLYGDISSDWKRDAHRLTWQVHIPANATALIYIPAKDAAAVKEGGEAATVAAGLKYLRMEDGRTVWEAGSGDYVLESVLNEK